jgi:hypothetical protein
VKPVRENWVYPVLFIASLVVFCIALDRLAS